MERNFCTGASNIYNVSSDQNKNIVSLDKRRYIILGILGASLFCTGESFSTFGYNFTTPQITNNLATEKIDMDLFRILFLISYAATAIVCPLIFKKIGIRWIIISGCSFNIFGVGLRIIYLLISSEFSGYDLYLKVVENIVLGCSIGLLSSIPTIVAISWFGQKEQKMSINIPLISTSFGIGVGFMNTFIFNGYVYTAVQVRNYLLCQILWEFAMNALVTLSAYLLITSEPRNLPSLSEMERPKNKNTQDLSAEIKNMINITKNIFSNKRSTLVLVISSINHGTYIVFFMFFHGVIDNFPESKMTFRFYSTVLCVILGLEIILLFTCIKFKSLNSISTLLTMMLFEIFFVPLSLYSYHFKENERSFNIISIIVLYISFLVLAPSSISSGFQNLGILSYPSDPNIASSLVLSIGNLFGVLLIIFLPFVSTYYNRIIFICLSVGIPFNIFITLKRFLPGGN